ncbi:MAG TPA: methyl-accepting chemotaxis protein [Treponemataceae bacterium]|nr:methyl-accepting chemotaxis protein [Treponemataceae bacterium]HPS45043.1 methyl-accepting chemotaxis protein [Treponemataceae bacterium]
METKELERNYEDALARLAIGYNKSVILSPVTAHSLEILDEAMGQVERGLNTIVSAFEEMRAGSNSTSENAGRIDAMMGEILAKNGSMDRDIEGRIADIERAAADAKAIGALFDELKKRTESVAGITGSIQDVSDRTGILAINASIEAARAGTVGRGFRIIANEVRSLANQTGDFAKQIDASVAEFQKTVDAISGKMDEFNDLFSRFKTSFSGVLTSFSENARTIDRAGSSLSEITGAIREEAAALNDGLSSLESVNDSMHETHAILGVVKTSNEFLGQLLEKGSEG